VPLEAGVQAEAFLFVVDGRLNEPLDDAASAAKIKRDAVVTERVTFQDADLLAWLKERRLA